MKFTADLHVHSKYSIATAKNLDLENLAIAAQLKGIKLIGTGDFTHPAWRDEIQHKLKPAEQGLFKLRGEIERSLKGHVPDNLHDEVRFILQTEISSIYKKKGKTRKNHNLVFMPDFDSAQRLAVKLSQIGNIHSDGRPILGLDAKDLLSIMLDVTEDSFLIPAHIWTPWFSVLGSKSGFDSIEECFEDLTPYIFAVETGLSSDPAMNWRVSDLDAFTLISNSDAHSPSKIGREANLFNTEFNYPSIRQALKAQDKNSFLGTLEFYPEEGKYHLDGHRNCNVRLTPQETATLNGQCPMCGNPLTCGVLYRVEELSNRSEEEKPANARPYHKQIGLAELLADILNVGPNTKKVKTHYQRALCKLGDELSILHDISIEQISRAEIPLLAEAVKKMRQGRIRITPGYDGEFGRIQIFSTSERERLLHQKRLFFTPDKKINKKVIKQIEAPEEKAETSLKKDVKKIATIGHHHTTVTTLNPAQAQAVAHEKGPLMIVAGPGTGKTRTLTQRIIHLIEDKDVDPKKILALTFTNKAAREMQTRISISKGQKAGHPTIGTFHSFCYRLLSRSPFNEKGAGHVMIIDDEGGLALVKEALESAADQQPPLHMKTDAICSFIAAAKQQLLDPKSKIGGRVPNGDLAIFTYVYDKYEQLLKQRGYIDYEGLIFETIRKIESDEWFLNKLKGLFEYVFVDEYQDLNFGQYRLTQSLVSMGAQICVIGDPDQSIYGFRGSDVRFFNHFLRDYPDATVVHLDRNYRSTQTILNGAHNVLPCRSSSDRKNKGHAILKRHRIYSQVKGVDHIELINTPTAKAEAVAVGKTIESLIGGTGFHGYDSGKLDPHEKTANHSFSDFAVLMRTTDQTKVFCDVFQAAGIPFQLSTRGFMLKQKDIAAYLSYFKILEGVGTFADIDRIVGWVKPGVGKETVLMLKNWSRQNGFSVDKTLQNATRFPVPEMGLRRQQKLHRFIDHLYKKTLENKGLTVNEKLHQLVSHTPLQGRLKNDDNMANRFEWLLDIAAGFDDDTKSFLSSLALVSDTDLYKIRAEKVSLMTMHAAKGLEFPVVFICGCEQTLIPYTLKKRDRAAMDEERRLLYVAMTRAQTRLYITWAKQRRIFGQISQQRCSPFIEKIDTNLLFTHSAGAQTPPRRRQLGLFDHKR